MEYSFVAAHCVNEESSYDILMRENVAEILYNLPLYLCRHHYVTKLVIFTDANRSNKYSLENS